MTWNSLPAGLEPSKEDTESAYCHVAYASDPKNMPGWAQTELYREPGRRRGTWEHVKAFVFVPLCCGPLSHREEESSNSTQG